MLYRFEGSCRFAGRLRARVGIPNKGRRLMPWKLHSSSSATPSKGVNRSGTWVSTSLTCPRREDPEGLVLAPNVNTVWGRCEILLHVLVQIRNFSLDILGSLRLIPSLLRGTARKLRSSTWARPFCDWEDMSSKTLEFPSDNVLDLPWGPGE